MPFCKFFSLLVLTFCLFHHSVSGEDLKHICLNSGNYTTNGPYETNLKELLSYLTDEAPSNGFAMGSKGEGVNRTHGLALCRGDISPTECGNCVVQASNEMLTLCSYNKGAIMWRENCTVRYSNEDFLGQTGNNTWFCFTSKNVSGPIPKLFEQKIQEFLCQISQEAVLDPKLYVSGKSELDEFNTAYGLAQCSRELSRMDCKKCLNQSLGYVALAECGQKREGVRVYSAVCRVRYELHPFFNDKHSPPPTPAAVSPHPAPTASAHGFEAGILVVIGLSSLFLIHFVIQYV